MDIPKTKELCEAERFVEGLKLLVKECRMSNVIYNQLGIITYEFADGSTIGGMTAMRMANIVS